jgi:hypothetical protein
MSNKQFEWTDETVQEFVKQLFDRHNGSWSHLVPEMKQFKLANGEKSDPPISPSPLFRTEDGVDIYEGGEMMYGVDRNWDTIKIPFSQFKSIDSWTVFAIPYNRDRYILMNKPTLSVNEVLDIFRDHEVFDELVSALHERAKAKL